MTEKKKNPVGSPTDYTEELANRICETVATSPLGTNKLCIIHKEWMPSPDTIYKWRYRHQEFADKYAMAKARQAELMAEELIDIADDGINDTYVDDQGNVKTDTDVVARSRLRVDTRKWYASKLAPKIYGDKMHHDHDIKIKQEDSIDNLK
jgi:hypothetical protein